MDQDVLKYIEQFSPDFQQIMFKIRAWVFEIVPEAKEAIKWSAITFSYQQKHICYLAAFKHHVTFSFYNGTMLRDPGSRLMGSGKFMKHIKLGSAGDMDEEQIRIWILEGFYS